MAPSAAVLSQTLKSITVTKIRELQKQQKLFNARYDQISQAASQQDGVLKRITDRHQKFINLRPGRTGEFKNIERWLDQARYDPSIPHTKLVDWEKQLLHKLEVEGRQLELTDLYSRLLTEWIEQSANAQGDVDPPSESSLEDSDSFEMIQSARKEQLNQLRDKFARVVFEPLETDEAKIDAYLTALFNSDDGETSLKNMRDSMKYHTANLNLWTIHRQELLWVIKALQKNDLLNDEKKSVLQEFLHDEAVLTEIQDVLNVRLSDIDTWSWDMGDQGLPVVPRQSANGKWRVMVDEDIIQALLAHYVGTKWAVDIKRILHRVVRYSGMWKDGCHESEVEMKKRKFFRAESWGEKSDGLEYHRMQIYHEDFFLAPLPSNMHEEAGGYDDEDNSSDTRKSGKEIKQLLLRTLATEVLIGQAFDKEVAVVQSDFQWFATGIPHSSIFATLKFMDFDRDAMEFVRKVLEPPLDMLDGGPVRTRKRGLPMAHVFEKLFGEVVLFFMDLVVNKEASQILYRFHDDLWLVGKPARCAKAWKTMEQFATIMGLDFNLNKTGSVYLSEKADGRDKAIIDILPKGPVAVHFLVLDPESGEWTINKNHVQQHVERLRNQLDEATSVLNWVQTWNSCIGRFFSYTFGEPAQCFGSAHLDAILETHENMQKFLFDGKDGNGSNVLSHLKQMISERFSISTEAIPDAFLYLPDNLGGLGLKNPFINLLLLRPNLTESPVEKIDDYIKAEKLQYSIDRNVFETGTERERRKHWRTTFEVTEDDDEAASPLLSWSDAQEFPPMEEFTKNREVTSPDLCNIYKSLLSAPYKEPLRMSEDVKRLLKAVTESTESEDETGVVDKIKGEELEWLVEFYREELMRDFEGLSCVRRDLLPLGVLGAMRKRKLTWQMVL